jgi:hypothetical protein
MYARECVIILYVTFFCHIEAHVTVVILGIPRNT